jgi:hypothetical protein
MGFASTYLKERTLFPQIIKEAPDKQTGIIVVLPAYNEPGICRLLDSLYLCSEPECKVEVIIVVNAPANSAPEGLENNTKTISNVKSWKNLHLNCFFRIYAFMVEQPSFNEWGVGIARKTGMDEALRRFDRIENPDGIILSLDADCLVENSYFVSVYNELFIRKDRNACSIYFEHPLSGDEFPENNYKYITLYELHLRYYFQCLAFSGFPSVFHTVGSAMAVKAQLYVKSGGMNRRKAGEDFYFIQKLVPSGGYFSLNSTTVYPSPRASSRVPFGTGALIGKLSEGNFPTLKTYNMQAFKELRSFFEMTESIFHCRNQELNVLYGLFSTGLKSYLDENEWVEKMVEIKSNTSGITSFIKRFFVWFNMFRVVKYLNYTHLEIFEKKPVDVSALEFLEASAFRSKDPVELLLHFRSMEKNS